MTVFKNIVFFDILNNYFDYLYVFLNILKILFMFLLDCYDVCVKQLKDVIFLEIGRFAKFFVRYFMVYIEFSFGFLKELIVIVEGNQERYC